MDKRPVRDEALGAAVRLVREDPSALAKYRQGGEPAREIRDRLSGRFSPARPYMELMCRGVTVAGYEGPEKVDPAEALLMAATEFVELLQPNALCRAWWRVRSEPWFLTMRHVDRCVFRGGVALALGHGPQVPTSYRFMQTLILVEFDQPADVKTVKRSYERLEEAGLLDVVPGRPYDRSGRIVSTCLDFTRLLDGEPTTAPELARQELTLSEATWTALSMYRAEVHVARAVAAKQRMEVSKQLDAMIHAAVVKQLAEELDEILGD